MKMKRMPMVSLSTRQSKIIRLLLNRSDYITVESLSDIFDISSRTVRNDLTQIKVFLKEYGVSVKSIPNKGTKIIAEKEDISRIEKLLLANRNFTNEERNDLVICRLLSGELCTYESLAETADVSRYTIVHSIDEIEKKLNDYGLVLIRNKGKGILVQGDEYGFRMAFSQIISTSNSRDDLFAKVLKRYCDNANSEKASEMIEAVERFVNVSFYNEEQIGLILSYSLYRISRDNVIRKLPDSVKSIANDRDYALYINALSSFGYSRNEDMYFASVFMNSKAKNLKKNEEADSLSRSVAQFMMDELEKLHSLNGEEKERFLMGLSSHLNVALYRMQNNIPIQNSLREQIRICLPLTYDFTKKQLLKCEEKFGITFSEDEISYIAMYVGSTYETSIKLDNQINILLVCSVGTTTSSILESRVKQLLPDCLFIGPFSRKEALAYLAGNKVDLIISTNEEDYGDAKTIVVNPLLYKQDIDYIRAQLFEINYDKLCSSFLDSYAAITKGEKKTAVLKQYIPSRYIQIVEKVDSWRDSIRIAARPLLEDKKIDEKYVDMMIRVVEEFGTYMVILPQTAFVHAGTDDGIHEECCSMLVMRKPLVFGDNNPKTVRNIVVVGVKNKEKLMILDLADILSKKKNLNYLKSEKVTVDGIGELSDR